LSRLRFWRDTDVAALPASGTAVMGRGILGEEWDEDIDNGSRPGGLIRLSETTIDNVPYVQDWGSTYDSGTATHTMTLYRAQGGALVFSAGSTQYSWGLGDLHTYFVIPGRLRPDPFGTVKAVPQATVNLLADGFSPSAATGSAWLNLRRIERILANHSPLDGTVEGILTITGVATDVGVVAGVEISVDAGPRHQRLADTEFQWQTPPEFRQATILVRAVDDGNNQDPSARRFSVQL
jgi:hypothetical protein